jgi:hypothetical protein
MVAVRTRTSRFYPTLKLRPLTIYRHQQAQHPSTLLEPPRDSRSMIPRPLPFLGPRRPPPAHMQQPLEHQVHAGPKGTRLAMRTATGRTDTAGQTIIDFFWEFS